jgi:hypothetical protein
MLSRSAPASSITPTHRRTRVLETPPKPGSGRSLRIPRPSGLRIHRAPWSDDRAGHPARCIRDPAAQEPTGIQCRPVLRSRGRRGDRSLWRHTRTTPGRENPPTGCRRACGRRQCNSIGFPTTAACGHGRRPRRHPLGQPLRASHPGAAMLDRPPHRDPAHRSRDCIGTPRRPCRPTRIQMARHGPNRHARLRLYSRLMTVAVGFHQLIRWS